MTLDDLKTSSRCFPIIKDDTREFLEEICKKNNPKTILEIGLCSGYSAAVFLSSCNAHLTSIEIDESRFLLAQKNLKKMFESSRFDLILGDACEIIPQFSRKYDMIFLDGPKGQYHNMLPYLIEMLNFGGVLIADNVGYFGKVSRETVEHKHRTIVVNLRLFLESLQNDKRFETKILDIGDGICFACKTKLKIEN